MFRPTISQIGLLVVAFLLASELLFVCILKVQLDELNAKLAREERNREVVELLNDSAAHLQSFYVDMIRDSNVVQFNERRGLTQQFEGHTKAIDEDFEALKVLLKDEPAKLARIERFQKEKSRVLSKLLNAFTNSPAVMSLKTVDKFVKFFRKEANYSRTLAKSFSNENKLNQEQDIEKVQRLLFAGLMMNFATSVAACFFFWKYVAARINIVTENIARLSTDEPLHEPLSGEDEVAIIDSTFHYLSDEILAAADREHSLIENSTDVICTIDSRGYFREVSKASIEQWGYAPEDLIDQEASAVIGIRHVPNVFLSSSSGIAADATAALDERVRRADGTFIDTLWSTHWSPADGSIFCIVRDRTDSKRLTQLLEAQENQVRNAIENMPLGILTTDGAGIIRQANHTAKRLLSKPQLASENVDDILIVAGSNGKTITQALFDPAIPAPIRCTTSGANGSTVYTSVSLGKTTTEADEDLVLLFEDASERVRLEELKLNFVSLLGESLRVPLDEVRTIVSSEFQSTEKESTKKRLARILPNIERLLKLLDGLLEMESLEPGKLVGALTPCAVTDIVNQSVNAVVDHAEQQKINLVLESIDCAVLADQQRLVQVVINLLTNAIKYSPSQSTVTVSVVKDAESVEIRVIDQGRGLPAELHESIFESYVQSQVSDAKRGSGTGLGLAICRQIVHSHNGTIGVNSEVGRGSIFWINLPLAGDEHEHR